MVRRSEALLDSRLLLSLRPSDFCQAQLSVAFFREACDVYGSRWPGATGGPRALPRAPITVVLNRVFKPCQGGRTVRGGLLRGLAL